MKTELKKCNIYESINNNNTVNEINMELSLWVILKSGFSERTSANEIRNYFVEKYYGLANKIALDTYRKLNSIVPHEDILSDAFMGLVNAIDTYNLSKNRSFVRYASCRIKGDVIDSIGQRYIPSKRIRGNIKKIERATKELTVILQRKPNDLEIIKHAKISKTTFKRAKSAHSLSKSISIHDNGRDDEDDQAKEYEINRKSSIPQDNDPERDILKRETIEELRNAVESLPKRQKQAIKRYYFNEMSTKNIAFAMKITEQRVRQLLTEARKSLSKKLSFMKGDKNIFS